MALTDLLDKQPIIGTIRAAKFISEPELVDERYSAHFRSYVQLPKLHERWELLRRPLLEKRTALGVLMGPLGYGKTGAAIDLWKTASQWDFLTVPPFVCTSLDDIMDATYGWTAYQLRCRNRHQDLLPELDKYYRELSGKRLRDLADQGARRGVDPETLNALLNEWTQQGDITVEITVTNLLKFLDAITDLAIRAGYRGLVVIPDEFRMFIESSNDIDRNLRSFKDLVWGLFDGRKPLGLVVSMLNTTWAELEIKKSEDIIHRLTSNNVKVTLEEFYDDTTFPAELWARLASSLNLSHEEVLMLPEETLISLGQFCRRQSVFNGPRSLVSAFQRAALRFAESRRPYDVFAFMEDYLRGVITFDGKDVVTKKAYADLVSVDGLVGNSDFRRVAGLLAAYPDGVPAQVPMKYGLTAELETVVKSTLGDHTVALPTLRAYVTTGEHNFLMEALRNFRASYNPVSPSTIRAAVRAFCNHVLPRILPSRTGTRVKGWAGHRDVGRDESPLLYESFELVGAPIDQYPNRRLFVRVTSVEERWLDSPTESHMTLGFFLRPSEEERPSRIMRTGSSLTVELNLVRPINRDEVPREIRKLGDLFLPQSICPLLLLACVDHLDRVTVGAKTLKESDKQWSTQLINDFLDRSVVELFGEELRHSSPWTTAAHVGAPMVDGLLARMCQEMFPNYRAIAGYPQWQQALKGYMVALNSEGADKLTLLQRRGHALICGSKEELANRFGYSSHETLKNAASNGVLREFIDLTEWSSKEGRIRLKSHPLEDELRSWITQSHELIEVMGRQVRRISLPDAQRRANGLGYLEDEFEIMVQLLHARRYIGSTKSPRVIYELPQTLTVSDMERKLESLKRLTGQIPSVGLGDKEKIRLQVTPVQLEEILGAIKAKESHGTDIEEDLDSLQQQIEFCEKDFLDSVERSLKGIVLNDLKGTDDLCRTSLRKAYPSAVIREKAQISPVGFAAHLADVQAHLLRLFKGIADQAESIEQKTSSTIQQALTARADSDGMVPVYRAVVESHQQLAARASELHAQRLELDKKAQYLSGWIEIARRLDLLKLKLSVEGAGSVKAMNLSERISALEQEVKGRFTLADSREQVISDWELYSADVSELEAAWNQDVLERKTAFTIQHKRYVDSLTEAGLTNIFVDTLYDEGNHQGSVQRLVKQITDVLREKLKAASDHLETARVEHLKAQRIYQVSEDHQKVLDDLVTERRALEKELTGLSDELMEAMIEDFDAFKDWLDRLSPLTVPGGRIVTQLNETRQALVAVMRTELTREEKETLLVVRQKSGQITDVFVDALQRGRTIEDVLRVILQLYRKGRLNLQGQVTEYGPEAG